MCGTNRDDDTTKLTVDGGGSSNPSDEALLLAWAGGDSASFDALYQRYRTALFRFITGQCRDRRLAEELFQDVWSRVILACRRGDRPSRFRAWLYRIARNRLVDHYRQAGREPDERPGPGSDHEDGDPASSSLPVAGLIQRPLQPEELALLRERQDSLELALQALPASQREVLLLKHVAGMTLGEIAEALDVNPETAKSRLRYAMNQLRQHLREPV